MKKLSQILCLLLSLIFLFAACKTPASPENTQPDVLDDVISEDPSQAEKDPRTGEYILSDPSLICNNPVHDNNRVFYEIFVGSFSDSTGNGVGDLRGIINRMDYLNDGDPNSGKSLGVEGLWLTPIFQSPSYHKYDVTDYFSVDKSFGTMGDLSELIDLCHKRDVLVILDLPINHTGRNCEWFRLFEEAHKNGDTESEYYNLYSWYDRSAGSAPAGRVFTKITGTTHYYECNFSGDMPELNFDSEFARKLVLDVANFYLDLGVDGFRFDAAKYVYYGDHKSSVDFWKWYLETLRERKPDLYTIAEVWDGDGITNLYYPATNCFDFSISQSNGLISDTAKKGDVNSYTAYIEKYLKNVKSLREDATIAPFIANHDTDRAAGFLPSLTGVMQMAANLYILGPGTPFIYYGEEIGMRGSRGGANTDANRRLAMLWGDGDKIKDPVGTTYTADQQTNDTVLVQKGDPTSLYTYYKKLLMLRKANPEIARGEYKALSIQDSKVGGFISTYEGSSVLVLHNTTGSEKSVDLSTVTDIPFSKICGVIGMEDASMDGTVITLGAQTSCVVR
ncbi:MAG: hypothetical protein IKH92_05530 [Clostridiales bacterium]|nr:hypothetical protein [Clostridiales bacterium]MBR3179532.1 hypothetical protein [Clostridia bacterium]